MSSRGTRRASTRGESRSPAAAAAAGGGAAGSKRRRGGKAAAAAEQQQQVDEEEEEGQQTDETGLGEEGAGASESEEEARAAKHARRESSGGAAGVDRTPTHSRTTSRQFHSPGYDAEFAPSGVLRQSRLAEKSELSALNKRLELYILRQRERDAAQTGLDREISLLRSKFLAEAASDKKRHEARFDDLKRQKLELGVQLQQLKDQHLTLTQQCKDTTGAASLYKSRCAELEKRMKKLEGELTEVGSARIALDGQVKRLTIDLAEETEARALLAQQLDAQKTQLGTAQKALNVVQTKANTTLQDLEMLQSSSSEEISQLNRQVKLLTQENQGIEEKLRREFGAQLKALLAERQLQYEEEKEEAMTELKRFYEQTLEEKSATLAELQETADKAALSAKELARELAAERKNNVHVAALRAEYEHTIAGLHEAAEQSRQRFDRELAAKESLVRAHLATIDVKEREFATLMDVKIKLDAEIKQYDKLLDHEEERLGFIAADHPSVAGVHTAQAAAAAATPAKSGRKSRAAAAAQVEEEEVHVSSSSEEHHVSSSSSSSRRSQHGASSAASSGGDNGLSVSVSSAQRRLTLTNSNRADESDDSAGRIALSGLTLVAVQAKAKLRLRDVLAEEEEELAPGQSLLVYTGANGASRARGSAAGQSVASWEDVDEEALWQDGETLHIKEGNKILHTVHIRV